MKNKSENKSTDEERADAEDEADERSDDENDEEETQDKESADEDDDDKESADKEDEDDDEEAETSKPAKRRRSKRSKSERPARAAATVSTSRDGATLTMSRALVLAAVTLIAGVAVGWGLRDARAGEGSASAVEVPEGVTPCDSWKDQICRETSAESAACSGAKASSGILPAAACNAALADMPATLERIKAARASCDTLVTKLCTDLGKESTGCQLVTAKTPSIPPEGCKDMLGKYDEVLAQLKMIGQRPPGMPGMMGPGGPPPDMHGHGAPPPGMPGGPPPGMRPPSKPGAPGTAAPVSQ